MTDLYVILEFNQASGQPEAADTEVYDDLDEARDTATALTEDARSIGRGERYRVYRLIEVDE